MAWCEKHAESYPDGTQCECCALHGVVMEINRKVIGDAIVRCYEEIKMEKNEQIDHMIEVLQAYKEGKIVEIKVPSNDEGISV